MDRNRYKLTKFFFKKACLIVFLTFQFSNYCFSQEDKDVNLNNDKIKYPKISNYTGKVVLFDIKGKSREPIKGEILKQKAHIQTSSKSLIQIDLDPENTILILSNTEVTIPVITWEDGTVNEVNLIYGQIRVTSNNQNERVYSTPITRDPYANADFILSYDKTSALSSVQVIKGAIDFRGMNAEIIARVGAGENVNFHGILESEAPSFDVLLKGNKVARGKLSLVTKIDEAKLELLDMETKFKKNENPEVIKKRYRQPGQICEDPFAKFNECSWVCKYNSKKYKKLKFCDLSKKDIKCVRQRCDANGAWADSFELPESSQKCQITPTVGKCDY